MLKIRCDFCKQEVFYKITPEQTEVEGKTPEGKNIVYAYLQCPICYTEGKALIQSDDYIPEEITLYQSERYGRVVHQEPWNKRTVFTSPRKGRLQVLFLTDKEIGDLSEGGGI